METEYVAELVDSIEVQEKQLIQSVYDLHDTVAKLEFVDMLVDELLQSSLPFGDDYIVVFEKRIEALDDLSIHVSNPSHCSVDIAEKRRQITQGCGDYIGFIAYKFGNVQAHPKGSSIEKKHKLDSGEFLKRGRKRHKTVMEFKAASGFILKLSWDFDVVKKEFSVGVYQNHKKKKGHGSIFSTGGPLHSFLKIQDESFC